MTVSKEQKIQVSNPACTADVEDVRVLQEKAQQLCPGQL